MSGDAGKLGFSELLITPMIPSDFAEAAALEAICFSDPWPAAFFRESLERIGGGSFFVTARFAGNETIAGYGGIYTFESEGEIVNLAVRPELRGRGIGRALMNALLGYARGAGVCDIFLEVRESNAAARSLYAGFGFEPISVRRGYYSNPREDAVVMKLRFNS